MWNTFAVVGASACVAAVIAAPDARAAAPIAAATRRLILIT